MNTAGLFAIGVLVAGLAGVAAVRSGFARWAFFRLYAFVKGAECVGPTLIHNPPVDSPYQRWLDDAAADLPLVEGDVLHDAGTVPLQSWPALGAGVHGLYLRFADYQMIDARIVEVPAGGEFKPARLLYEQGVYVLAGAGETRLGQENRPEGTIDWAAGDLFSVPLNVRHRHRNTGDSPARLLLVTTFPLMLNLFDDVGHVTGSEGTFRGRYDGEADYLRTSGERARLELETNIVRDIRTVPPRENDFRGRGNRSLRWKMAGNTVLDLHISELPPRMIKRAHRITSNAFVLVLSGTGFTVQWPEGLYSRRRRVDWRPGTVFAPPVFWYQQHLNTGPAPARYLAINVPGLVRNLGLHFEDQLEVDLPGVLAEWRRETGDRP